MHLLYIFSVLCFGEYFEVRYTSLQQNCPDVTSLASLETPSKQNSFQIQSEVYLGRNCNYFVYVVLYNESGETASTGMLLISKIKSI